uniref:Uncharacterized protein n=1 Tax=Rhizophora mucronata TaxID=61149 RepID=A0A2P2NZZ3_RHIMU
MVKRQYNMPNMPFKYIHLEQMVSINNKRENDLTACDRGYQGKGKQQQIDTSEPYHSFFYFTFY